MKTPARLVETVSPGVPAGNPWFRRSIFLLLLLLGLGVPLRGSAELLYFCALSHAATSGPWPLDVDLDGTPDLEVAVAGQNLTVRPAIGVSVLATNRSYYTNIASFPTPVLVGFPDEVAALAGGTVVAFANPSTPFWRERQEGDNQSLNLPLTFVVDGVVPAATNYFAVKMRHGTGWILAWVRVRVTTGAGATCSLDWGYDTRRAPLVVNEMVVGARPVPATVLATEKVLGIPLDDGTGIDLDADGIADVSFGGVALTTFGGGEIFGGGTIPPSVGTLSYGLTTTGQTEVLRSNSSAWIFPEGSGIADFVPAGTAWAPGSAALVSTGLGTNVTWTGALATATNGYVGVRLYKNNDFYYGWIHLELSDSMTAGLFGPAILGWALESRAGVPIVAGDPGVAGEVVLIAPTLVGNVARVNVSGLSRTNVILSSSPDLLHWTPLMTNAVPFSFVDPVSPPEPMRFFRAMVAN